MYLSRNNFEMVQNDYRRAVKNLQPAQVKAITLQELTEECRRESKRADLYRTGGAKIPAAAKENTCLSWPEAVLEERQKVVRERLVEDRKGARQKVVFFTLFFGVIFLILPTAAGYLLLAFFFWLYRHIRFVK
jgi:hypothetical protein